MRRLILIISLALPLGACAGETAMRSVSSQSAVVLNQYRAGLRDFAQSQNQLNSANAARVAMLNGLSQERLAEINSRVRSWRFAGNQDAQRQFDTLRERDSSSILAAINSAQPQPRVPASLGFDAAGVETLLKQLLALQKPRTAADKARDLLNFSAKVRESYDASVGEATGDAKAVASDSQTQAPGDVPSGN